MLILGLCAAVVAAFCWALSAALIKLGSENLSPLTANLVRMIPALIVLAVGGLAINIYPLMRLLTPIELSLIVASSVCVFVIGDLLYIISIQYIGVSRATPVTAIYPLFVLILQIVFLGEAVHLFMLPAVVFAIFGVSLLGTQLNPSTQNTITLSRRVLWIGAIAAVGTAASWSVSIILLSEVLKSTHLVLVAILRLLIATLVLMPLVIGNQPRRKDFFSTSHVWFFLGLGGIIALVGGYIAFAIALQLADTTSATILSSITPIFAVIIGWRSLQEQVDWRTISGAFCCTLGIALTAIAAFLA